jgi:hypothetical protein
MNICGLESYFVFTKGMQNTVGEVSDIEEFTTISGVL